MSPSLRKFAKSIADPLGGGNMFRKSFVEIGRLGEYAQTFLNKPVSPSDTILLTGSGRSGTTWLGDLLSTIARAQQIFEPLAPFQNPLVRELTGWEMPPRNVSYIRAYYLNENASSEEWKGLWLDILTGKYRTYWTDANRNYFFPDCFLVKEVYASLMLGYISRHFTPKIVHLVRHPCAVIASRLAVPWYASVNDILKQEELVEDHLRPWISLIEKEKDLVGAHAVWWAVENLVAVRQLAPFPHQFVYYEETVTEPEKVGTRLARWLDRKDVPKHLETIAKKPSRMTQVGIKDIEIDRVLSHWQRALPVDDQKRIIRWARELGIDWYDGGPMPVILNEKKSHIP